jgi:hypothetical protein
MKIVALIARILLGALFVFAGANHLFNFIKMPPPPGQAGVFVTVLVASGFMYMVGFLQAAAGLCLIAKRYVLLSMVVLGAIILNIDAINVLIVQQPINFGIPAFATLLWALVFWEQRALFKQILTPKLPA